MAKEPDWVKSLGTEIDPDTGMPVVPEGYFWRVKPGQMYAVIVELRRKWFWGFTHCVEDTLGDDLSEDGIRNLAAYVLNKWEQRAIQKREREEIRALFGDYPPKKLGTN